jgi:hypothetical protein
MKRKKVKPLVKMMTYPEAVYYCESHTEWKIPNLLEAQAMDFHEAQHVLFWIEDKVQDRNLVYNKMNHSMKDSHPVFKNYVVLVRSNNDTN